jgi:tetratricopeptide (TPR) repeat protein
VVKEVTDKIKVKLTPDEKSHLKESLTINPDAYKNFLSGKHNMEKMSAEDFGKAKDFFEQSIALDDSFAPAYAELANLYMFMLQMRLVSITEAFPKIFHSIRKALTIDPDQDQANLVMAFMSWFEWDWIASEKGFLKVLETNPNHVLANAFYALYLMLNGRNQLALSHGRKAVELDPMNDLVLSLYSVVLLHGAGQIEKAFEVAKESMEINPQSILTLRILEEASYPKGDLETSVRMLDLVYSKVFPIQIDIKKEYVENGYALMIEKLALELENNSKEQDYYIALFFNRAGKSEKAIEWILRAYENHDPDIPYLFVVRELDNLKSDPRIREIAEKVKLPLNP